MDWTDVSLVSIAQVALDHELDGVITGHYGRHVVCVPRAGRHNGADWVQTDRRAE